MPESPKSPAEVIKISDHKLPFFKESLATFNRQAVELGSRSSRVNLLIAVMGRSDENYADHILEDLRILREQLIDIGAVHSGARRYFDTSNYDLSDPPLSQITSEIGTMLNAARKKEIEIYTSAKGMSRNFSDFWQEKIDRATGDTSKISSHNTSQK